MSFSIDFLPSAARQIWFDRTPSLGPGTPVFSIKDQIESLRIEDWVLNPRTDVPACLAGFWLWFDFLQESHSISQEISGPTGAFWHAIMHRREPDAWNSKYWFRQVGSHPVLKKLESEAPNWGYPYTTPFDFVDFVERVRDTATPEEQLAQNVQKLEWSLLMRWCVTGE